MTEINSAPPRQRPAPQPRPGRGRLPWTSAAIAGVTVALLGVGVAFFAPKGTHAPATATPTPPVVPAGTQPVSYHGVEVFVPAAWKIGDTQCGTPMHDTAVLLNGAPVPACYVPQPPGLTVVYLSSTDGPWAAATGSIATTDTVVEGSAAKRGRGKVDGYPSPLTFLVVPSVGVVVAVESPDAATADNLVASTHLVTVDSVGCRSHVDSLTPSTADAHNAPAAELVTPGATAGSVCSYDGNWLMDDVALSPAQIADMTSLLNGLPVGVSHQPPNVEAAEECAADLQRGFVVHFNYPDGSARDVYVHIGGCGALSASNGARTTQISSALGERLVSLVDYAGGFYDANLATAAPHS
jgi:hypothetical protein